MEGASRRLRKSAWARAGSAPAAAARSPSAAMVRPLTRLERPVPALIGQDHAEVLDGLGYPAVRGG